MPRGAVILAINAKPIEGIDDFAAAITRAGHGERLSMRYTTIDDPNGTQLRSVRVDRRWFPGKRCERNDASGVWDCTPLAEGLASY